MGYTKAARAILLSFALFSSLLMADANKGMKIYMKFLKPTCAIPSAAFARMHTQDEWEVIKEAGKLADEIQKICPNATLKPEYEGDLYDFVYEYAKDSGNIPAY